jgi:hypothetical protein
VGSGLQSGGKAGGFTVAGPSKGPDRNRENNNVKFRSAFHFCGSTFDIHYSKFFYQNSGGMHIPVFVKLLLPPGRAGGSPNGLHRRNTSHCFCVLESCSVPSLYAPSFKCVPLRSTCLWMFSFGTAHIFGLRQAMHWLRRFL